MADEDENQHQPRSLESNTRAFVEFVNRTNHPADIFWINYTSGHTHYTCVKRSMRAQINTYVTHPWVAFSYKSKERMLINFKETFHPQPFYRFISIRGANFEVTRQPAIITFGMRSLLNLSKDAVALQYSNKSDVEALEIPKTLKLEIIELIKFFNDQEWPEDEPTSSELQVIRGS